MSSRSSLQVLSSLRQHWRRLLLVAICACGGSLLFAQPGAQDTSLLIQRIILPADRAAKELDKVQQGALLLMPLGEFDARVERLRKAAQTRESRPRVTRAHYAAELVERSLTGGGGQWAIAYDGPAAAIMPVAPINVALHSAKWEKGGDAILADFDGKSLGLLVEPGNDSVCMFDWSARGTPTNDGLAFKLAVPLCPISTFEFKLPADAWLTAPKGATLVDGPHAADSPAKRLWRLQAAGGKPIEFLIRTIAAPKGPGPVLFAQVHSEQKLAPDRLEIEHDFQIDIPHGALRALTLEGDPGLQPYDVTLKGGEIKSFLWKEGTPSKDPKGMGATPGQLTVQFPQPIQGKVQGLHVRSLAPWSSSGVWTSPFLRVKGAVSRGETLTVHLAADLPMSRWDHGTFQPTNLETRGDGTQVLSLADTAADAAGSRRPTLIVPPPGIDLRTTEHHDWQITPRGAVLTADIQFMAPQGNPLELRLKLPKTFPGYQIESLEVNPASMLRGWQPEGAFVVVDLKQPLTPTRKVDVKVRLRSAFREMMSGIRVLAFPELEPVGPVRRKGSVAIQVAPNFQAQIVAASLPLTSAPASAREQDAAPGYRFDFREQKLTASIRLVPQPMQVHLRGKHAITLEEQGARMQFRWEAEAAAGAAEHLDFRLPPDFPAAWRVVEDDGMKIHHWERLHLQEALPHLMQLGAPTALHAAALRAATPDGTYWRFHLSAPLDKNGRFTLEAIAPVGRSEEEWRRLALRMPRASAWECIGSALAADSLPPSAGEKLWTFPLMMPVQRVNLEQEIAVESLLEPMVKATADGALRPTPAGNVRGKAALNVQIRQVADGPPDPGSRVQVWTRPEKRPTSALEACDQASVSTFVHKDGRIYHRLQFRLVRWRDSTALLRLPAGQQIVAVKVQDRWLRSFAVDDGQAQVRLTLPVDQNAEFAGYEIITRTAATGGLLPGLVRVEMPRVDWPIAPLEVRERWFMESGLTPLFPESMAPHGVPLGVAEESATPRRLRHAWAWGEWWWPTGAAAEQVRRLDEQRQSVLAAEAELRKTAPAGKTMKLGEALERLATQHLKEATPIIVDRVAFRALGLTPDSVLAAAAISKQVDRPFWESFGVYYLPTPDGAVLTSPRRLQSLGIRHPSHAATLAAAVQQAIRHGQDASSGFALIVAWLNVPTDDVSEFPIESSAATAHPLDDQPEMIEWQVMADGHADVAFWVVDPLPARAIGWLIALTLAVGLWRTGRSLSPIAMFRAYVFLLTFAALLAIWLPILVRELFAFPSILVVLIGFFCHLIHLVARRRETPNGGASTVRPMAGGAAAIVLVFGLAWQIPAQAQPQAGRVYPVLVIEGARPVALITPELHARMEELENPPEFGTHGAVLTRAKYAGKIQDGQATIEAEFEIHSFKPKATVVIPLAGVVLQEGAFLDGGPAFPGTTKSGYTLTIRDKGAHRLRLTFAVRTATIGDQQELRFTAPRLVQNEMSLQWLSPVQAIQCLQCLGEEKLTPPAPQAGKEWRGQLGYDGAVQLRWRKPTGTPTPKLFDVKEAHYWDLRPGSLALLTSLHYALGKDSLTQLGVALPDGLQVRAVEAVAVPGAGAPAMPIVVKQWAILGKGPQRRAVVDFSQPVGGNVILNLDIVPQAFGLKRQLPLLLPAPLQGASRFGIVGYRLDAVEIQSKAPNLAEVRSISAEEFDQQWKKHGAPPIPVAASRAYTMRRVAQQAGLELVIEPTDRKAQLQVQWNLDRHYAEVSAKCVFTSSRDDLMLLEFFVDKALVLADVTGPDVARWNVHESLVQVWLRQPRKQTTIDLSGWPAKMPKAGAAPLKSLALPALYPLQTRVGDSSLQLRPAPDVQATAEARRGLRGDPVGVHRFTIQEFPYEANVALTPLKKTPDAALLARVNATDQGIEVIYGIRVTTERGTLPALQVRVKDWPHGRLQLEAPGASTAPIPAKVADAAAWSLKYPAGLPGEVFITLRGRLPKDATPASLPTVAIDGANLRQRWLAWKNVELGQPAAGKKITPGMILVPGALAERWLSDRASWHVAEAPADSLVVALPKTPMRGNVRILASTDDTRWTNPPSWVRQASWLIHAPEGADLRIQFPAAVAAMSIQVNDRPQAAWNPGADEYALALEAAPEPRWIKVSWRYTEIEKKLTGPNVAGPTINLAPLPAAGNRWLWTPPGAAVSTPRDVHSPTLIQRLLDDAATHLAIIAALAEETPRSAETARLIAAEQGQLQAVLRQADYAAALLKNESEPRHWSEQVAGLRRKHQALVKERRLSDVAKSKATMRMPAASADFYHSGIPMLLSPGVSNLTVQFAADRRSAEQRTATELLLVAAIFLLVFSYFRKALAMLLAVTPEITMVLAGIGIWLGGPSLLGAFLIVAMLLARAVWILSAWRHAPAAGAAVADDRTAPPAPPPAPA